MSDYMDLSKRTNDLESRITAYEKKLEAYGTLDGEARLEAREIAIELARMKEELRHFDESDEQRQATDAADLAALRTQLDAWTAQIDRHFKHGRGDEA